MRWQNREGQPLIRRARMALGEITACKQNRRKRRTASSGTPPTVEGVGVLVSRTPLAKKITGSGAAVVTAEAQEQSFSSSDPTPEQ
ncbi:hypothetical protein MUK42_05842 [Musa troglodytarum]|uniref:Uncharacterized protein n=1 Tax=Musa troglodytarum TaxID=320322 RepID=A0A9E7GVM1_9LILI|nr:hypothetical protein MUK42_05842 [Musa troglodytarum]